MINRFHGNKKLTSEEWLSALDVKCEILDPDGWDRKNYDFSFREERITFNEFFNRMDASTCVHTFSRKNKFCSCMMARPNLVMEFLKIQKTL